MAIGVQSVNIVGAGNQSTDDKGIAGKCLEKRGCGVAMNFAAKEAPGITATRRERLDT